jgi:hypothetical protein
VAPGSGWTIAPEADGAGVVGAGAALVGRGAGAGLDG